MEILILAVLGLVFTLTVLVVVLKLLIALVLIPFKLLGAILGGAAAKLAVAGRLFCASVSSSWPCSPFSYPSPSSQASPWRFSVRRGFDVPREAPG